MLSRFTGNRDIDFKIMMILSDEDLKNFCKIENTYLQSLCSNETFWFNRFVNKFGKNVYKAKDKTWREYYEWLSGNYHPLSTQHLNDMMKKYGIINSIVLDKENITVNNKINEHSKTIKKLYNENYRGNYILKSDLEIKQIIGDILASTMPITGITIFEKDIASLFSFIGIPSVQSGMEKYFIIPREGKLIETFVWTNEKMSDAQFYQYYMDVTDNNNRYYLFNVNQIWKENPNIIFIPYIRVAGTKEEIYDYFIQNKADPVTVKGYIALAYTKDNVKANKSQEFEIEQNIAKAYQKYSVNK